MGSAAPVLTSFVAHSRPRIQQQANGAQEATQSGQGLPPRRHRAYPFLAPPSCPPFFAKLSFACRASNRPLLPLPCVTRADAYPRTGPRQGQGIPHVARTGKAFIFLASAARARVGSSRFPSGRWGADGRAGGGVPWTLCKGRTPSACAADKSLHRWQGPAQVLVVAEASS